jgi:molybdopterin-guanine dinucleotide biosynthesis protein A
MNASQKLNGLVLAGGRSSRMGRDKAALIHPDGRTLARRTYDLLVGAGCDKVILSLRHDQEMPAGFSDIVSPIIVRDPPSGSVGPITGMVSAMRHAPESAWLIVACDLPRLDAATLSTLVESKQDGEKFLSYRSEFDGLPEPLCALYSCEALPVLENALADDLRCPRKILIRNDCRLIDPVSARALDNANTPEDWATAITS